MAELVEIRVRTKVSEAELDKKVGKIITESDYNILLTGPTKVTLPNGKPLCIYLPKALIGDEFSKAYEVLHKVRGTTNARQLASGTPSYLDGNQRVSKPIMSNIIGNVDNLPRFPYCRTTAWTGQNTTQFKSLYPLFGDIAKLMETHVPDRYENQLQKARTTPPEWVVGDTPWTTMTVNNTYPTGVHKDSGDLDIGFSCLAVWRRGDYTGGNLTFPEYRISVNMQEGDLILMDAHEWHGNTELTLNSEDAERISLVLYYRTKMMYCGTLEEEAAKEVQAKRGKLKKPKTLIEQDQDAMKEFVSTQR